MKDTILGPDAIEWLGVRYKTILRTDETGGAMAIVDTVAPPRSGPPRHVHHAEDETFVVLSGEIEAWLDGKSLTLGPGESAMIPRGAEHTFRVIGDQPCRKLVILTPGGFEGFFADMAAGRFRIPEDIAAVNKSAQRHHMTFTGPPLGDRG